MPAVLRAALWMLGTLSSFALMAIAGRQLSADLSTWEILAFRSAIGLLIALVAAWRFGWHHLSSRQTGLQVVRNLGHFIGQYGWFYGLSLLPLAQVFALEFTSPIWAAILAPALVGERITPRRALVIAIGFIGIMIVIRPGAVPLSVGTVSVLIAAVSFAFAYLMTKRLMRTDTALTVVFYMSLVQLPLGLVPALFHWVTPPLHLWPWLVIVGVAGLSAHFCLARAFSHADAVVVVPMDFLRLPLIAVAGLVFYGERLDPWILGGAAVIFAGNFLNVWGERHRGRVTAES